MAPSSGLFWKNDLGVGDAAATDADGGINDVNVTTESPDVEKMTVGVGVGLIDDEAEVVGSFDGVDAGVSEAEDRDKIELLEDEVLLVVKEELDVDLIHN